MSEKEEKAKEQYAAILAEMTALEKIAWQYVEAYLNWQIEDYSGSLALYSIETLDGWVYIQAEVTLGGTHSLSLRINKDMPEINEADHLWMYNASIEIELHPDATSYEELTRNGDDKYFWIAMYASADDQRLD